MGMFWATSGLLNGNWDLNPRLISKMIYFVICLYVCLYVSIELMNIQRPEVSDLSQAGVRGTFILPDMGAGIKLRFFARTIACSLWPI